MELDGVGWSWMELDMLDFNGSTEFNYCRFRQGFVRKDYEMLLRLDETVPKKGKATEEETSEAPSSCLLW